jgi:uncharacterized iron-regulated membrane protein
MAVASRGEALIIVAIILAPVVLVAVAWLVWWLRPARSQAGADADDEPESKLPNRRNPFGESD